MACLVALQAPCPEPELLHHPEEFVDVPLAAARVS